MKLTFGVVSADSHGQLERAAFLRRMSLRKFGDRIPQLVETSDPAHGADSAPVERWFANGQVVEKRGVANCPAAMPDRRGFPQHWSEVPAAVYDPQARLKALAADGVDGEVLFPNPPAQAGAFFQGDTEFELACVRAYNDAMKEEWQDPSSQFIGLGLLPYLDGIAATVAEAERVAKLGLGGVVMLAEPGEALRRSAARGSLPAFADPYWEPLWAACQSLDLPVHWHANAGLSYGAPTWSGYSAGEAWVATAAAGFSTLCQFLPNLVFAGMLERYPRMKWVCAETAVGWVNYVLEACDHEWERRRLWSEGIATRPSERLRQQLYMSCWFERDGMRNATLDPSKLMWQSDYPHAPSTYPRSRETIGAMLEGIPAQQRGSILSANALRLYKRGTQS